MKERLVVVSLPGRTNEFQHLQAADAEEAARRLHLDVQIVDAEGNAILQIQQLFKFIHAPERPRALLVEPIAEGGMERVAQKAAAAGIGFGLLNCAPGLVEAVRAQYPALAVFALGSDQVEIGRIQGRQMRRLLPRGGTALYVQGPLFANVSHDRFQGTRHALADGHVETVVLDAPWSEEGAEEVVQKWLRLHTTAGQHLDLVACQSDAIARGTRRAFEAMPEVAGRWGDLPFLGVDGVPSDGERLVREGALRATVVMQSNTGPALDAVDRWLRFGTTPPATIALSVRSLPPEDQLTSIH